MNTTYSTDPTVRATLARLPAAGPIADRAADLVSQHERCVGQALAELPPATPTERVDLVEPPAAEGGAL
ncbi:MAG TPA: hypothetical protein VD866_25955 [Urbifossiella sp.]|nr:hypothetical protein [Urbifossiella sp.]